MSEAQPTRLAARLQAWYAETPPTAPEALAAYRHEFIDILEATIITGADLCGDLTLTQQRLESTQCQLQLANDKIILLRQELAASRTSVQTLQRTLAALTPAEPSAPPLPETQDLFSPPKFNGDRLRLKSWKNSVNIKLSVDAAKFPSNQHQLAYVYGHLEGRAMDVVQPYVLATGIINLVDIPAMFAILDRIFGDPDPAGTASRALRLLKQKGSDLSTYVAEFSRLAADVPWNDRAKLDYFQEGLCYELKQALVPYPVVTTLEELIDQASRVEQKLTRLRTNYKTPQSTTTNAATPRPAQATAATPHPRPPISKPSGRPRLTPEERVRRRANGLCIACGSGDHFIAQCPIRKSRPRPPTIQALVAAEPASIGEESGKELSLAWR